MGQEASLPVNEAESLEEQAKFPPSTSTSYNEPVPIGPRSGGTPGGLGGSNRSSRKIMGAMFRHNVSNYGGGQSTQTDYEQKEMARATAMDGNLYMNSDGTSDDFHFNNGNNVYTNNSSNLQQKPSLSSIPARQDNDLLDPTASNSIHSYTEQSPNHVPMEQQSPGLQQSVIGIFQSSAKKGIFSSKGTRNVINTMRNLTMSTGLRKQKEVDNWEKQWDDDDDDSDSESAELGEQIISSLQQQQQHVITPPCEGIQQDQVASLQYSSQVGTLSDSAVASPPFSNLEFQHQQHQSQYQQQQKPQHTDSEIVSMPLSPPRIQHQHLQNATTTMSYASMNKTAFLEDSYATLPVEAEDLLSKPTPSMLSQPQQSGNNSTTTCKDNENVDWDVPVQQSGSKEDNSNKPNVQMFMPMLRVLGKGSFGKVW